MDCPICWEPIDDTKVQLDQCGHTFHDQCLAPLVKKDHYVQCLNEYRNRTCFQKNSHWFACPNCRRKQAWDSAKKCIRPIVAIIHFQNEIVHLVFDIHEMLSYIKDGEVRFLCDLDDTSDICHFSNEKLIDHLKIYVDTCKVENKNDIFENRFLRYLNVFQTSPSILKEGPTECPEYTFVNGVCISDSNFILDNAKDNDNTNDNDNTKDFLLIQLDSSRNVKEFVESYGILFSDMHSFLKDSFFSET